MLYGYSFSDSAIKNSLYYALLPKGQVGVVSDYPRGIDFNIVVLPITFISGAKVHIISIICKDNGIYFLRLSLFNNYISFTPYYIVYTLR